MAIAMNRSSSGWRGILAVFVVSPAALACAPTPELATVPVLQSDEWSAPPANGSYESSIQAQGWAAFGSSELDALIDRAMRQSPEIDIAAARVAQARGTLAVASAGLLPTLNAVFGIHARDADILAKPSTRSSDLSGGLTVGYEVDLFGENRAARRADRARLLAAGFDAQSTRLLVASTVATTWFAYLALDGRVEIVERAIANAAELERIIAIRYDEGVATRVDFGLQEIEVRNLRAQRSDLVQARDAARTALAVLVGEEAPRFAAPAGSLADLTIPAIAPGQPSVLLIRRPDIRAAETRIAAADGDVLAARRAFLPNLRIDAGVDGRSSGLGNPLTAGLNAVAGLFAPIFNGGRLRGNLERISAEQRESVAQYRLTLLQALAEGENAITSIEQSRIRRQLLDEVVREARLTAALAREQYVGGVVDARTALEAERELLAAEEAFLIAQLENATAVVDVYRVLGGGPENEI